MNIVTHGNGDDVGGYRQKHPNFPHTKHIQYQLKMITIEEHQMQELEKKNGHILHM